MLAMSSRPCPALRRLLLLSAAVAAGLLLQLPNSSAADPAEPAPTCVITRGPNGSVSHFIWRDPSHILSQSRSWVGEARWGNFLFEDVTGGGRVEQIGKDVLDPGGHLLYLPGNEWILNDTYPKTERRLQTPHLYHVASGRRFDLGHFHLPPEYTGEWRVDTHPRLNRAATVVCIDAPHGDEGRQLHLIDIRGVLARGGSVDAAAAGGTPAAPAAGRPSRMASIVRSKPINTSAHSSGVMVTTCLASFAIDARSVRRGYGRPVMGRTRF
jgi:hypothetical protein